VKLVHLVGFIIKNFVTTYGHMNVKNYVLSFSGNFTRASSMDGTEVNTAAFRFLIWVIL